MRKKMWIILLACLVAVGLIFGKRIRAGIIYYVADSFVQEQKYIEAKRWYSIVEDRENMERCDNLRLGEQYRDAVNMMFAGKHDAAKEMFREMEGFKDSKNLILECDYLKAEGMIQNEDYFEAIELLKTLRGYKKSETKISESKEQIFKIAEELCYEYRLEEASAMLRRLGDYGSSKYMLEHCERLIAMEKDENLPQLLTEERLIRDEPDLNVYNCELGYLMIPKECNKETRFFIYYPGGRNIEISIDFVGNYIMGAAPNTMALFLHKNGVDDMRQKNDQALELLDRAAMENGVFPHDLLLIGSSMGAYPVLHSIVYCYEDYGISVDCAILLDAGNDWVDQMVLTRRECKTAAQAGTAIYLFEDGGAGIFTPAIYEMVTAGNDVTLVECENDDHERITFDALGLGVIDWALGQRTAPLGLDIYTFERLG